MGQKEEQRRNVYNIAVRAEKLPLSQNIVRLKMTDLNSHIVLKFVFIYMPLSIVKLIVSKCGANLYFLLVHFK